MILILNPSSARKSSLFLPIFVLEIFILSCFLCCRFFDQQWWRGRSTNYWRGSSDKHVTYCTCFRHASWRRRNLASSTKRRHHYSTIKPPCSFTKKDKGWKDCWTCPSVGQFVDSALRWCKLVDIYIFLILFFHTFSLFHADVSLAVFTLNSLWSKIFSASVPNLLDTVNMLIEPKVTTFILAVFPWFFTPAACRYFWSSFALFSISQ